MPVRCSTSSAYPYPSRRRRADRICAARPDRPRLGFALAGAPGPVQAILLAESLLSVATPGESALLGGIAMGDLVVVLAAGLGLRRAGAGVGRWVRRWLALVLAGLGASLVLSGLFG